ncbi:MAG: 3-hydroxyacyl-CoA dehydrogenase NAD-binding domain-containing protein [Flavobacteriales bacterium]
MEIGRAQIGIIGAGAMGSGIAQVAAQSGHRVILIDQNPEALERSERALASVADRLLEKGRWSKAQHASIQQSIHRSSDWNDLAGCKLIIEAIIEDFEIKRNVFQKLEQTVDVNVLLASNTSSLSLTGIAGCLIHPKRFLGLHFFNPAPLMDLVEVIPALQTNADHVVEMVELMNEWGKKPVIAKDTPGFIVNRVARPFYGEALRIFEEGIANKQTIDAAMRDQGFRMGPFELMDLIGNDVNYAVTQSVFEAFYYDPRYRPSLIQKRHVEAGWLGKKSGRGYYDYSSKDGAEPIDKHKFQEVSERIIALLINEAADALYLNIASAQDLETAMTKGVNYPKGLLRWANEWGIDRTLQVLNQLRERYHEDRYRPSPILSQLNANNSTFLID